MNDENTSESKKGMVVKIIVPVLIVCVVAGIWAVKNKEKTIVPNESKPQDTFSTDFELHVTEKLDLEKLKSYGLPIIIDFGADYCAPCREMAPVLEKLNTELRGRAIIKFVDVSKYEELTRDYPISVIPTQIFIDANGRPYKPENPEARQMRLYSSRSTGEHVLTMHEGGMTREQLLEVLREMGMK